MAKGASQCSLGNALGCQALASEITECAEVPESGE
jgi:hypothetical protein